MYHFKRKMYAKLLDWKENKLDKALLISGPRQIGKTFTIREFGANEFDQCIELNLADTPYLAELIMQAANPLELISSIGIELNVSIGKQSTLIFVDEIQQHLDILSRTKMLLQTPHVSWIFSSSLFGTHFNNLSFYPMGYLIEYEMYPMDFEEFCWAIGTDKKMLDPIKSTLAELKPVSDVLHTRLNQLFRAYVVVGGMPEVVKTYLDTRDLLKVGELQRMLNRAYQTDIVRYSSERSQTILDIFDLIPAQLSGQKKRFILGAMDDHGRYTDFQYDFSWLVNAGVALKVNQVSSASYPAQLSQVHNRFKLYQSDTGMLIARFENNCARIINTGFDSPEARELNAGIFFENVIAQSLTSLGLPLFYYQTKSRGKVDFVVDGAIEGKACCIPVEVKSGSYINAHKALDKLLETYTSIPRAYVFSERPLTREEKLVYLPFYSLLVAEDLFCSKPDSMVVDIPTLN